MAHGHHHHHHVDPGSGDGKVALAVGVNLGLTVAQVVGGIVSGSLALIADALHNFSDAMALIIAFAARRIARRPADGLMTFGYGRIEAVAALINYTTLTLLGLYLLYEGILRFADPQPIAGWIVVIVAGVALAVDLATAALTWKLSRTSVNIRAAFLHNLADALGSVGVIVAGTLILLFGWQWVDPLITLAIAGYILWQSVAEMPGVMRILMMGSPPGLDPTDMAVRIGRVEGVSEAHHLHLWMLDEHRAALSTHVVVAPQRWHQADEIKARIKEMLAQDCGVDHVTLELECTRHACTEASDVGSEPNLVAARV